VLIAAARNIAATLGLAKKLLVADKSSAVPRCLFSQAAGRVVDEHEQRCIAVRDPQTTSVRCRWWG
jgi:hypothetical protein